VPSDALVAVLDQVVPGMLLQKLVLVLALAAGGVGVTRLLGRSGEPAPLVVRLVAVTVYGWNAYLAERLLMGQWPVLVGYAVLPWLLVSARRWRLDGRVPGLLLVLVPLGCLSASAGLATSVALLAAAVGRGRTLKALSLLALGNAPWLVSGLLHASSATSDAAAARIFALHGEGSVPAPLAALTLGGIWNSDVVPDSRAGPLGWLTLAVLVGLAVTGARSWWRRTESRDRTGLVACWVVGWVLAVLTWAVPGPFGWAAEHVPGAGVVRDGARLLVLCAPLLAVLVAEGVRVLAALAVRLTPPARVVLAVGAVLVPVALLPDLALGVSQRIGTADYPTAYDEGRAALRDLDGDVLVLPLSSYRAPVWNDARPVLDPVGRYLTPDYVASDVLVVDGVRLAGEDPRVAEAEVALALDEPAERASALGRLGIGAVVTDPTAPGEEPEVAGETLLDEPDLRVVVLENGVAQRGVRTGWLVAMALAWAAFLGLVLGAGWTGVARRRAE
jgi:hypothetical protein